MCPTVASSIVKATTTFGLSESRIGSHSRWQEVANENETDRNCAGLHTWICCDRHGAIAKQQQSTYEFGHGHRSSDTRHQCGSARHAEAGSKKRTHGRPNVQSKLHALPRRTSDYGCSPHDDCRSTHASARQPHGEGSASDF